MIIGSQLSLVETRSQALDSFEGYEELYLLGSMGEVGGTEAAAWLRFDWYTGRRLGAVHFRRSGAATSTTNVLLGFGAVVSCVRFDGLLSTSSMMASKILKLIGLSVSNLGRILDVVVDELFVGHVDQGSHVDA